MIDHAIPIHGTSGLKLSSDKTYTIQEIYVEETRNIAKATLKYLTMTPTRKEAPSSPIADYFNCIKRCSVKCGNGPRNQDIVSSPLVSKPI